MNFPLPMLCNILLIFLFLSAHFSCPSMWAGIARPGGYQRALNRDRTGVPKWCLRAGRPLYLPLSHIIVMFTICSLCRTRVEEPITVAKQSRPWNVFARSNAGIVGENPTGSMRLSCVCAVLCRQRSSDSSDLPSKDSYELSIKIRSSRLRNLMVTDQRA
jgi:hypothetical protein